MFNTPKPIFFKNSNQASKTFGWDVEQLPTSHGQTLGTPVPQFLFMMDYTLNNVTKNPSWLIGFMKAIKSAEFPQVEIETTIVNQYNKHRVISKGIKYSPLTITFHDTSDGCVRSMWADYYAYYYGDAHKGKVDWAANDLGPVNVNSNIDFGFNPTKDSTKELTLSSDYFFAQISIYKFFGKVYSQYTYINPRITAFKMSPVSYDSNETGTIDITFEYESLKVEAENELLEKNQIIKTVLDSSKGEVYEPPTSGTPSIFNTTLPFGMGNLSTKIISKLPVLRNQKVIGAFEKLNQLGALVNPKFPNGVLGTFGSFDFGEMVQGTTTSFDWINKDAIMNKGAMLSDAVSNVSANIADTAKAAAETMSSSGVATTKDIAANVLAANTGLPITGAMNLLSDTSSKVGMKVSSKTADFGDFI